MSFKPRVPRQRRASSRRGLTLLEVMIAVIIIGFGFVSLLSASARCLKVVKQAREFETARTLMERLKKEDPLQLDEVDGDEQQSGTFDEHRNYRWERELTAVGEESDQLYLVKTRVVWEADERKKKEEVVEYLHLPTAIKKKWIDEKAAND